MIVAFSKGLGKLALLLVAAGILVVASLFVFGSYLVTWPLLRTSPRNQKVQATVTLAGALMQTAQAFRSEIEEVNNAPKRDD